MTPRWQRSNSSVRASKRSRRRTNWRTLRRRRSKRSRAIRKALAGFVTGAADLAAARQALRRVFDSFTLCRYGDGRSVVNADLASGEWYIIPNVRADAILVPLVIGRDQHGEPTVDQESELSRVPVIPERKLNTSRPSLSTQPPEPG